ncbi:hypothetical protein V6Z12_D05G333500 [Gossypium hirsutum]
MNLFTEYIDGNFLNLGSELITTQHVASQSFQWY